MAVALVIEFSGGTAEQYDKTNAALGLTVGSDVNLPNGLIFHVAGPVEGGWLVIDVWDSREDFDRFLKEKLSQAVSRSGLPAPAIREVPVYNLMRQRTPSSIGTR